MRSGKKDDQAKEMFDEAAKDIEDKLVKVSPHGLTYIAEMKYNRLEHKVRLNIIKMINNMLVLVKDKGANTTPFLGFGLPIGSKRSNPSAPHLLINY